MYISKELRKKNIAEYLLYMWQVEDIIRANGLDADKIELLCRVLEITPNRFFGWKETVKKQQIQNGGVGNTQHMDSYAVELLQGQLNIKDEQIKEKDAQIAQLLKLIAK